MRKNIRIRVQTIVRPTGNGNIQIRTTTSNGTSSKTTTKTVRPR